MLVRQMRMIAIPQPQSSKEEALRPPPPHQTGHADFPHPAFVWTIPFQEMDYSSNELSETRSIFRDFMGKGEIIKDFKFPRQDIKPKILHSKNDLNIFLDSLPSLKYK